jgi:hypothetical protein
MRIPNVKPLQEYLKQTENPKSILIDIANNFFAELVRMGRAKMTA